MSLKHYLLLFGVHAFVLAAGVYLMIMPDGLSSYSIVQWDAHWFAQIAADGYTFNPDEHSSTAFFPLFPWLIKALHNLPAVVVANVLITGISLYLLSSLSNTKIKDVILFLSAPLLLYFIVPYSEALFLLGSTLLLCGLNKRNLILIITGAFIAILSRYAAMILLPALVFTAVFEILSSKENFKNIVTLYTSAILTLCMGLALVSYIQYVDTGVWNGYQQTHIHWHHYARIPDLPFYSAMGSPMLLLDQVALLISVISGITLLLALWHRYKGSGFLPLSSVQFLSLCYLAGSGASMLFFQGGSLDSLGRYIFASAFLFPLFPLLQNLKPKGIHLLYMFISCSVFFVLTGSLASLMHFISNEIIALLLTLFYSILNLNKEAKLSWNYVLIWGGGLAVQSLLFLLYLSGSWVE